MPPVLDENHIPRGTFRTPSIPPKSTKAVRHLRSASQLATPSGIRAPSSSSIPLFTKKSFDLNISLLEGDRSISLDKTTLKEPKDVALALQPPPTNKMADLEKAMRALQRGLKSVEGMTKMNDDKADSRMLALENRVASLETEFELFQRRAASSAPHIDTPTSLEIVKPGFVERADVEEVNHCASPPVPALARSIAAQKRMSWAGGVDTSFQRRLFGLDEENPFDNRRGSIRMERTPNASITKTSIQAVDEGADQAESTVPYNANDFAQRSILAAIASLEARAKAAESQIAQLQSEKISLNKGILALMEKAEQEEHLRTTQSEEILALRSELGTLRDSLNTEKTTDMGPKGVEKEFAKLYLIELGRREEAETQLQVLKTQLAAASQSGLITTTIKPEEKAAGANTREGCGMCDICDGDDAGDVSLVDASL